MKNWNKIAMIGSIACAVALAGMSALAKESGAVLTEVGSVEDPDGKIRTGHYVLCEESADEKKLYSYDGKTVDVGDQWEDEKLTDGYCIITVPGTEISESGLMKADGTMLIPTGPAIIKMMDYSERFVRVIYAEEQTENEDEAMFYTTSAMVSFAPSDQDVLYKGYWKIYDLQTEQFVDALTFTSNSTDVQICADETIWVKEPEKDGVLYDADGTVLADSVAISPSGAFFLSRQSDMYIAYDNRFNRLFESNYNLMGSTALGDYIEYNDGNNKYGLLDADGNIVLEAAYDGIDGVDSGFVQVWNYDENKERKKGVLTLTGDEVLPCEYDYIYERKNGYLECEKKDADGNKRTTCIGPNGTICSDMNAEGGNEMVSNLSVWKESGAGVLAYVINDAGFTLKLNTPSSIQSGLLKDKDPETGKYALFDTVTGEQLLDYDYNEIMAAYDYIYAYKDGAYTIYKAEREDA